MISHFSFACSLLYFGTQALLYCTSQQPLCTLWAQLRLQQVVTATLHIQSSCTTGRGVQNNLKI